MLTRRVVERNAAGEPLAFVGVALDMTERVEHRRQAEELARRLDAASRAAGIGIWTTTAEPEEADWNAQMFALFDRCTPPRAADLHEWLRESVHPDDRERVAPQRAPTSTAATSRSRSSCAILHSDGSVRWIVLRADLDRAASTGAASSASRSTSPSTTRRSTRCATRASAPR